MDNWIWVRVTYSGFYYTFRVILPDGFPTDPKSPKLQQLLSRFGCSFLESTDLANGISRMVEDAVLFNITPEWLDAQAGCPFPKQKFQINVRQRDRMRWIKCVSGGGESK